MRLIDGDELIEHVWRDRLDSRERIANLVESMPTIKTIPAADVAPVIRCKECIHNNDCDIQYSTQAGENFFCGFGETEKDVREDVYE